MNGDYHSDGDYQAGLETLYVLLEQREANLDTGRRNPVLNFAVRCVINELYHMQYAILNQSLAATNA